MRLETRPPPRAGTGGSPHTPTCAAHPSQALKTRASLTATGARDRSIGCESDPTDQLGLSVYLWTLIRLVDVWVDEENECAPAAHEQIVRVCKHGRVPLPRLLRLPISSASASIPAAGPAPPASAGDASVADAGTRGADPSSNPAAADASRLGPEARVDTGSILAPLIEKLMETGHVEEFVEQVRRRPSGCVGAVGPGRGGAHGGRRGPP